MTQPSDIDSLRADYDATPYASDAFPQSAPGRLAAVAHVFGLRPPTVDTARVLEIGCAAGGNLIPFAAGQPRAQVVGIDLSPVQIEQGRSVVTALGLTNLELVTADIAALDPASLGQFDYIIAHGVYSWVPDHVRDALLAVIRSTLSPQGAAYLSYNTYPGWKSKEVMRDAMLLATGASTTPADKARDARDVVDFLREVAPPEGVLARVVAEFAVRDQGFGDYSLLHDELETFNAPCYFYEFLAHAQRHGLGYLAEARPESMFGSNYGPTTAEWVARKSGGVQVLAEQYLDFVANRAFRESLVVHAENASRVRYDMAAERFVALHLAAWSPPVDGPTVLDHSRQEYEVGDGATLFTNDPGLKAGLEALNDHWPWTLSRSELVDQVRGRLLGAGLTPGATLGELVDNLIGVLVIQGHAHVRLAPVRPEPAGDAPRVAEPIRRLAARARAEESIYNLWHETVIPTALDRLALPLLDGTRDRDALVAALVAAGQDRGTVTDYVDGLTGRLRDLKLA